MWIRPAPDTMTYVTALLPVQQGVAVYAALKRDADTTCDERSRGQIMADSLVERVTGRPADKPVPVALNLVMADTTLAGDDDAPAWLDGYGPIPAGLACRLTGDAITDKAAKRDAAPVVSAPDLRAAGGDGIAGPDLPDRVGGVHRPAGSDVSDSVLQRRDPPP